MPARRVEVVILGPPRTNSVTGLKYVAYTRSDWLADRAIAASPGARDRDTCSASDRL